MAIVDKAMSWSGAMRRLALGNPEFMHWLELHAQTELSDRIIDEWFAELSGQSETEADKALGLEQCRKVLRLLRKRVFFLAMVRDLAGLASLEEVTCAMTQLAQIACLLYTSDAADE